LFNRALYNLYKLTGAILPGIPTESGPFKVLIDTWENDYANKYKTWPDKYYCLDKDLKIVAKSEYGKKKDALINVECYELIQQLIEQLNE
jgi:hypothetical protein